MMEHPSQERLNEYLDAELDSAAAREVERHVESCVTCRGELRALERLLGRAAELPRSIEPERDLWAGISGRIQDPSDGVRPLRLPWLGHRFPGSRPWELAAAAVLLIAATATLTWNAAGGFERGSPPVAVEMRSGAADPAGSLVARELAAAEGEYLRTTARLLEILDENRTQLAPETREALDRTLETIDAAIRDLRSALEEDPNSRTLGLLLESTYREKIEMLRRAVQATGT